MGEDLIDQSTDFDSITLESFKKSSLAIADDNNLVVKNSFTIFIDDRNDIGATKLLKNRYGQKGIIVTDENMKTLHTLIEESHK